ncbi:MAG: Lrp/AsnC family transcriptional regulator [Vibrio sp.]
MELDHIDRILLEKLQEDSNISLTTLADMVNLTTTPCWKRLKKLEQSGVIAHRVALLDADKLGLSFVAFVMVQTNDHSHEWYEQFVQSVQEFPEVMEFYRMAGEYDYMMKVVARDMRHFDEFYKKLVNRVAGINNVTSTFAMESLKYTTKLPLL